MRAPLAAVVSFLTIFDHNDVVALELELKTTFDKFRKYVQLRNFVDQRVNFRRR
jgi:hypothetical protein